MGLFVYLSIYFIYLCISLDLFKKVFSSGQRRLRDALPLHTEEAEQKWFAEGNEEPPAATSALLTARLVYAKLYYFAATAANS